MKPQLSKLIRDPLLEKIELQLKGSNFFSILNAMNNEIRHSNFLSWLLDPNQSHGLSYFFLRKFLKDIFSNYDDLGINEFEIDNFNLADVEIRREWANIDLVIISSKFVVTIENKLWSGEGEKQLQKYREVINKSFPLEKKAFIFLTPFGVEPRDSNDKKYYQTFSYFDIARYLSEILNIYSDQLSDKNKFYINDYFQVIKRYVMKEDELNLLARKIYRNHKEAINFIIENKPDLLNDVSTIFEKQVEQSKWILETQNKGYTRFLTEPLSKILPKTGTGWKGKESFLFEIDYWPKSISFKTVISPGDEQIRVKLSNILSNISGAKVPRGNIWLVHFSEIWKFDITNPKNTFEITEKKLREIWPQISQKINILENELLKNFKNEQ